LRTGLLGCVIKGKIFILGRTDSRPITIGSGSNPASDFKLSATSSEAGNPVVKG